MQYGTIIINTEIAGAIDILKERKEALSENGNIFILLRTEYDERGDVVADCFDLIDAACALGYKYKNTIVVPTDIGRAGNIPDNVLYIIWLVKSHEHYFNKDAIRESHIWQKVEWGHREKNYNPNGKDPGNVWIPTVDDGKAHITAHVALSVEDVIQRLYKSSKQESLACLYISNHLSDNSGLPESIEIEYIASSEKQECSRLEYVEIESEAVEHTEAKVIWGTSESMSDIADGSVRLVVTSPPYWDLKDYFKKGQIGQEPYEKYLDRLHKVWSECYKKLSETGSMWININIRVKNNEVVLIPKDFIRQCKTIGFHYKGILIWHKSSGIPTSNKNLKDNFEFVLIFSKSETLHISSRIESFADYKNDYINGGVFWNINRKAGSVGKKFIHPAIYPAALVERIVESGTCENQTVLDPFLGSGTTIIAAISKGRNCIGYEYNEGFKELITSRIKTEIGSDVQFELII